MAEIKKDPKKQQRREAQEPISIVRIVGKDVDGSLSINKALQKVKGISFSMSNGLSNIIESKLNISRTVNIGSLSEEQLESISSLIKDPLANGIPQFLLNRRKDFETGKDIHSVSSELIFNVKQDISRDITNRTWRGYRHQYGQKVRGQRSRSTGRTGASIGVSKKVATPGTAGAAAKPAEAKK